MNHEQDLATLLGGLPTPGPVLTTELVPYDFGSPATGGLLRIRGEGWSWFGKVLQHPRHWPGLAMLPPADAASFAADFPWRSELELWDTARVGTLPEGLRVPELYGVVDLGDDRLAVWMEDVDQASQTFNLTHYQRAAYLLGRWNARCTSPDLLARSDFPTGYALRMYAERAVAVRGLLPLADDRLWAHPWLADHGDLRRELRTLAERIPALLDALDACVQAMPHGDASPQNLLLPADSPDDFVVIDVSFRSPHALGFDLGQLLVGLTEAGQVPAARLGEIAEVIVPAYLEGLAAEALTVPPPDDLATQVRAAYATSAMLRSGFDGLRYDLLDSDAAGARHSFDERIAMTRFLLDQHAALTQDRP